MTLEEFREAEEQPGNLYELAKGVLEVVEVPSDGHGHVVDNLREMISLYRQGIAASSLALRTGAKYA
jgi:hypothetical protein